MSSEYDGEASRFRKQIGLGDTQPIEEGKVTQWAVNLLDARYAEHLSHWTDYRRVDTDTLVELGVGWSPQKKRYTIPVRGKNGSLVDVKLYRPGEKEFGKSLHYTENHRQPDGTVEKLAWGKPPRLWGLDRVAATSPGSGRAGVVLVCAGEPDAIVATALGYLAVSPTSGEGSLCRKQDAEVLLKAVAGGWPIRLLFDIDVAGRAAAGVWGGALWESGFRNIKDVFLPFGEEGKDLTDWVANDVWRQYGEYEDAGAALWAVVRATAKLDAGNAYRGSRHDEQSSVRGGSGGSRSRSTKGSGSAVGGPGQNDSGHEDGSGGGADSDSGGGDASGRRPVTELLDMALTVKLAEYGSRNRAGFWLWCQFRDERYSKAEALQWLDSWVENVNAAAGSKPGHAYTHDECRLSLDEAYSSAPRDANGKGLAYPMTDLGNAERFVARHGGDIAYSPIMGEDGWLVWNGRYWQHKGGKAQVERWAQSVPRMMYEEGAKLVRQAKKKGADDEELKKVGKLMSWARASESAGKLNAIVLLSRSHTSVPAAEFDAMGDVLNCQNGTLVLGNKQEGVSFRGHLREDRLSFSIKGSWDPLAQAPEFDRFVKEILPDEEVRTYLQRLVGYSLVGGNPARKFIIVHGPSASGKSTLSNILQEVLGDYAQPFKLALLRDKQDEGPRADIVGLLPARIIFASEASEAWHLHADQVKHMTGDEPITARGTYAKTYVTRYPAFTPWLLTNGIPTIKGADAALWRRLIAIPFEVAREAGSEDLTLKDRIVRGEGAGVLRWAVDGYLDYLERGLDDMPEAVALHTMRVREEMTELDQWLAECTEGGAEYSTFTEVLFENYKNWCMANHIHERDQLTLRGFGKHLSNRGYGAGSRARPEGVSIQRRTKQGIRIRVSEEETQS